MPDVILPAWLSWFLVVGIVLATLKGIVMFGKWTVNGVGSGWVRTQKNLLRPHTDELDTVNEKIDALADQVSQVMGQLTAENGGSFRESFNALANDVKETRLDLREHITVSAEERAELRGWLTKVDPEGPPGDIDTTRE